MPPSDTAPPRDAILAAVDRIVESPAFRASHRSQEFLRYVVTHIVDGRTEVLKERSIGTDVFGRPPDYDTGEDSIVRVKASEVRKRLAQYYRESPDAGPVVIELPPGSYAPEIRWAAAGALVPGAWQRWKWRAAVAAVVVLAAAWTAAVEWRHDVLDSFWQPVLRHDRPVLLCVAHPAVWRLAGPSRRAWDAGRPPLQIPQADLARDTDHYVGFGDAMAMSTLSDFFARRGKPVQLRIGTDTSFTDLRGAPAVLIGAFTNQWTVELTGSLRFVFERVDGVMYVRDRMDPARRWTYERNGDYAVISRIFDARSGQFAVAAAGLSHYGTQAAGEFLTRSAGIEQALRDAPTGWPARNLQFVLHADVIGRAPAQPKVVAAWYW